MKVKTPITNMEYEECMNDILGGVQLGSSTEVFVAWWGDTPIPYVGQTQT